MIWFYHQFWFISKICHFLGVVDWFLIIKNCTIQWMKVVDWTLKPKWIFNMKFDWNWIFQQICLFHWRESLQRLHIYCFFHRICLLHGNYSFVIEICQNSIETQNIHHFYLLKTPKITINAKEILNIKLKIKIKIPKNWDNVYKHSIRIKIALRLFQFNENICVYTNYHLITLGCNLN